MASGPWPHKCIEQAAFVNQLLNVSTTAPDDDDDDDDDGWWWFCCDVVPDKNIEWRTTKKKFEQHNSVQV